MGSRAVLLVVLLSGISALSAAAPTCVADFCPVATEELSDNEVDNFEAVEASVSHFELMQKKLRQSANLWTDDSVTSMLLQKSEEAVAGTVKRVLQVGDPIVAKWPAFRNNADNPWFAGTVKAVNAEGGTCSINYEDGDFSSDVKDDEVLYAPNRPDLWGKGDLRGNDKKPRGARKITLKGVYDLVSNDVWTMVGAGDCRDNNDLYLPWGAETTTNDNARAKCAAQVDCHAYMNDNPGANAASYTQYYCTNRVGLCTDGGNGGGDVTKGNDPASTKQCFKKVS